MPSPTRPFCIAAWLLTSLLPFAVAPSARGQEGAAEESSAAIARDSALIMADLRFLSSDKLRGRAVGTEGNARARERIARSFGEAGLSRFGDDYMHAFPAEGRRPAGVNVVGWVEGTAVSDRAIVVSAHYDHEGVRGGEIHNGADDNASGTAALMAIARFFARNPPRHPMIFAAFDAEESGLAGARAFVADPPVDLDDVAVNVNLDMVARPTDGVLWAAGGHHTPALEPLLRDIAADAPLDLRLGHDRPDAPEGADWTRSSDHAAFHARGVPFVYFGVDDHADYHRPTDDFERVDPGEFLAAVRIVLDTLTALDGALPFRDDGAAP